MLVEVVGKPLRYNGKYHQPGTLIDLKPQHANLFILLRKVKLPALDVAAGEEVPKGPLDRAFDHPPLDELPKPKRKYKRRDMKAE